MYAAYSDRTAILSRVVEMQAQGWRLKDIAKLPGMPCRPTLWRWARKSPTWAAQLAQAQGQGAVLRGEHQRRARVAFDPVKAHAFIDQVRRGRRIADLSPRPEWPSRSLLTQWRRGNPPFAAALDAALADARRTAPRVRWRYSDALADRIILALIRGATLADLAKDPTLPGVNALRRWRRTVEGFDGAVRAAMRHGERARKAARSKCTPPMISRIEMAIVNGASLWDLAKEPEFPCEATLYRWLRSRPEFAKAAETASRFRDQLLLDEQLDIAALTEPATVAEAHGKLAAINQRLSRMRKRGRWAHEEAEGPSHPDGLGPESAPDSRNPALTSPGSS